MLRGWQNLTRSGSTSFTPTVATCEGAAMVSTSRQLLEFLRSLGAVSPRRPYIDRSALGQLTRDYERFLISERGLALSTVVGYVTMVRRFLTEHFESRPLRLQDLRPQ